jgi:hypothetical protein
VWCGAARRGFSKRVLRGKVWHGRVRQGMVRRGEAGVPKFLEGIEMATTMLMASELVWDKKLYPRQGVGLVHVNELADALRVGDKLPPLAIDSKTKKIVDGVHRWFAYRKVHGNDYLIPVEIMEFENDADLFLYAVSSNSAHGAGLTSFDKTNCLLIAEKFTITRERMMTALRIPPQKCTRMLARTAFKQTIGGRKYPEMIPLKGSLMHLRGEVLSIEAQEVNKYSGGMSPLYYVKQMCGMIETGVIGKSSPMLFDEFVRLSNLLQEHILLRTPSAGAAD